MLGEGITSRLFRSSFFSLSYIVLRSHFENPYTGLNGLLSCTTSFLLSFPFLFQIGKTSIRSSNNDSSAHQRKACSCRVSFRRVPRLARELGPAGHLVLDKRLGSY